MATLGKPFFFLISGSFTKGLESPLDGSAFMEMYLIKLSRF